MDGFSVKRGLVGVAMVLGAVLVTFTFVVALALWPGAVVVFLGITVVGAVFYIWGSRS